MVSLVLSFVDHFHRNILKIFLDFIGHSQTVTISFTKSGWATSDAGVICVVGIGIIIVLHFVFVVDVQGEETSKLLLFHAETGKDNGLKLLVNATVKFSR